MDRRITSIAIALYAVALVVGFVFASAKVGVIIAIVGAMLLAVVYRVARPAGATTTTAGRQRNRARNRR